MNIMSRTAPAAGTRAALGRIHAITINLQPRTSLADLLSEVNSALDGASDLDLIVLPESCLGVGPDVAEPVDGPTVRALSDVARQRNAYVLAGLYLAHESECYVSSVLVDRSGSLVGVYDKRYPYWSDLTAGPQTRSGSGVSCWPTDFGKLGSAICFDVNFPQVWADLADAGVDLVVWPSAYAGGEILRSYAQIHHFHVLTCTQAGDSRLYDPIGTDIAPEDEPRERVRQFDIDLDRGFYHHNFNLDGLQRLLADHGDDLQLDAMLDNEEWFVLSGRNAEVNVRDLARSYGLEEIRDYLRRSRQAMDELRVPSGAGIDDAAMAGRR